MKISKCTKTGNYSSIIMSEVYTIIEPKGPRVPILLSVPHCGTEVPNELKGQYNEERLKDLDDTDWFVHRLYDFASELGITMIHANFHRWVVDLNRDPESKPLYNDGRIITGLCTLTDFHGNEIYKGEGPNKFEVEERVERYYKPYHNKVRELLDEIKQEFGRALLYDAHSIRDYVPTIRKERFPELTLGDNDGQSAHAELIKVAMEGLDMGDYELTHNTPFKGGQITRSFGDPKNDFHALQLEMSKLNYMDDAQKQYAPERAEKIREILIPMFKNLIDKIQAI